MLYYPVERLKLIGTIEGISFLVLLGIAMPLKYIAHFPAAVTIAGSLHGLFFVLFLLAVANVTIKHRWPLLAAAGAVLASVIPFGTFVLNSKLSKEHP
ncbi:DUF3817 domain-containing protein [Metabacillus sp. RGM 3146]|uniref:DUF3817 domain-containing protein n=1 Tax=Metabacillus sp. RGM 3146 TaxID=3401092 RepID=UPI003B996E6A